jgi:DNA-binding beta-propeller fold protein YncE
MKRLALALILLATSLFAADDAIVRRIPIGGEGGWDYVTIDSAARRLYASHSDRVVVVDIDNQKIIGTIPNTLGVHGIALNGALGRGYVSDGRSGLVTVFDLDSLKVTGEWKATGDNPDAILYDPYSKKVLTFNGRGKNITVFDAKAGSVIATIDAGGKPEFAVSDHKGHVFVNIEDTSELAEIDTTRNAIAKRWKLTGCEEPSGLAIDRPHKRLFSVCGNETMIVSDFDGKIVKAVPIGKGPDGVAFDDAKQIAYSSNGRDGTITAVHVNTGYSTETIKTAPGARTIALDEKTHHLFLPTAKLEQSAEGRMRAVSGTFEVLEVAP